jgi:hypothetical protein
MQTRSKSAHVPSSPAEAEQATFMDVVTGAPAAAALVVAALGHDHVAQESRNALRLVHPLLRDAVDSTVTDLSAGSGPSEAQLSRTLTARRFPAMERLALYGVRAVPVFEGMRASPWHRLTYLTICQTAIVPGMELVARQALVAALRCMPRLAELEITHNHWMRDADVMAIAEVPLLALHLFLTDGVGPAAVRAIAAASWPLELLQMRECDLDSDDAGPAVAELHRHVRLRHLLLADCGPGVYAAMAKVHWPALEELDVLWATWRGKLPKLAKARAWAPALVEFNSDVHVQVV